jgi:hypothetical protein
MTYKRSELCEEHTYYEVKDFTARAGAPKTHLFHFAPSPNSAQACQDDTQPFFRIKYVALTLRTKAWVYSHAFNRPCQKLRYLGYISGAKPEISHAPVLRPLLKVERAHHQARSLVSSFLNTSSSSSASLTSNTRSAVDDCRQAKSVDRARWRLFLRADRRYSRRMATLHT